MKLHFLGGASEVGASCTLIEIEGHRLLVDAGIRMGAPPGQQLPNLSVLDEVGAPEEVLITHAHSDHTGALPALVPGLPPTVPLRCTGPTRAITGVLLRDALKIMQQGEREGDLPLYPPEAVELTLARMAPVSFLTTVPICGGALKATWIPAGHILGAASIYIEGKRESLLMSGDVSVADQRTVPGMAVPDCRPDLFVLESTYGQRRHADRSQQETALTLKVAEVVEAGGKVLVPAFAVGRAQEVILILARAMHQKQIPAFPVFVDGMVRAVNAVYASFPEYLTPPLRRRIAQDGNPFYTGSISAVGSPVEREKLLQGPPCCIVASSGMLTGGASAFYAERLAGGAGNLIAITGYQDEESPGRALLDLARAQQSDARVLKLNNQLVPVSCRVETYSLSAHADSSELAALAQRIAPRAVYLVHGDEEARAALATTLDRHLPAGAHLPLNGEANRFEGSSAANRRSGKTQRHGLGSGRPIDAHALQEIRTYLVETGSRGLFRIQDLAEIWCGTEHTSPAEVEAFREVLDNPRDSFTSDLRRPYLFRIAEPETAPAGPMEMNQARTRIQETFPPESGLFRCSIRQEEGAYELAFHFPDAIRARHADQLVALEEETGWTIRLRDTPHQGRLFEEALNTVPAGAVVVKSPALHLQDRKVVVGVEIPAELADIWEQQASAAAERFAGKTGYGLVLELPGTSSPAAPAADGEWEINRAYAAIKEAFAGQPHAPYKIGRKAEGERAFIEVAFISPAVGARYEHLLQELTARIGWPIRVRPSVNQQQIAAEARRITPQGCTLRGTPRLYVAEKWVAVPVVQPPDAGELPGLQDLFKERTGFSISWETAT